MFVHKLQSTCALLLICVPEAQVDFNSGSEIGTRIGIRAWALLRTHLYTLQLVQNAYTQHRLTLLKHFDARHDIMSQQCCCPALHQNVDKEKPMESIVHCLMMGRVPKPHSKSDKNGNHS